MIIVACPNCTRRQEVSVPIPPQGLRYACVSCQAPFMVQLPPGAAPPGPPAPPPPGPLDAMPPLPEPPAGFSFDDLPMSKEGSAGNAARGPDPGPSAVDEFAPQPTVGAPENYDPNTFFGVGGAGAGEFAPSATVALPRDDASVRSAFDPFSDLPAPAGAVPPPQELPGADLPAPRGAVPPPPRAPARQPTQYGMPAPPVPARPAQAPPPPDPMLDLLAPRESAPRPDDLLAPRESAPRPDDLLAPRESMPRPDDLLAPSGADDLLAPAPSQPGIDDLLLTSDVPGGTMAGFEPAGAGGPRGADLALDLFGSDVPSASSSPLQPLDLGPAVDAAPRPPGAAPGPANPLGFTMPPEAAAPAAASPDVGFSLELEGGGGAPAPEPGGGAAARPLPTMSIPAGNESSMPQLAPLTARPTAVRTRTEGGPSRRKLMLAAGAVAGVLVVGAGAVLAIRTITHKEPTPEEVLGPLAGELARDHFPAYQRAADQLAQTASGRKDAVKLRAAAAELWLVSVLARGGDRNRAAKAEQLLAEVPEDDPPPEARRARALLAVARGKPNDVARHLAAELAAPASQLAVGLRDLTEGKPEPALKAFEAFAGGHGDRLVARYLIGRALEGGKPAEAAAAYKEVLAKNPAHFGAALGLARLEEDVARRFAAAEALLQKGVADASPGELTEAHVIVGRGLQAVGRSAEAMAAFKKALAVDAGDVSASIAYSEALMLEGRQEEALERLRGLGAAAQKSADGKFALGGALIATDKGADGLVFIQQAARERPTDPRGLYWTGYAAETSTPPDLEAAAQNYRAALKLEPKYLPATLRLAALLQRQGRASESLAALREAEQAGVAPQALQLAFGEALIVAKEPGRAVEVFRKAVEADPKLVPARIGLAAALDAQGDPKAAKEALEKTLAEIPDAPGVRERLAAVSLKLGLKDEAMDIYHAEIRSGSATPGLRVAMAKLALELGRLDEAQAELTKVIEETPSTPEALFTMARVWEARGEVGRALSDYRRAQRYENSPVLNLAFARALLRANKEAEALSTLEAALSLAEGRLERGRFLFRKGEYDKALLDFEEAARLAPRSGEPLLWQGKCHDKLGETARALEALRTAVRVQPDLAEAQFQVGRVELEQGRARVALEHLRRAAARVPEGAEWAAELHFQLGTAELTAGSRSGAIAPFKKYLELAPADAPARPEVERQLDRLRAR